MSARCGICYIEAGQCRHTLGYKLPEPSSEPNRDEPVPYVPAQRGAAEVPEESEYKGPSFAYGPAGPAGPQGPQGPQGPAGMRGTDGKSVDPTEVVQLSQRVMKEFFDAQFAQLRGEIKTLA